jgi:branched-chain amino acid transport system ATP-binding protein
MSALLEVHDLHSGYGSSQVLFGVSLSIDAGGVSTLLGRNGMGKTTTVHTIMGLLPARRGTVEFEGTRVEGLPAFRIARLGFGLVPEGRQIFPNLSVRENLLAASANRTARPNPWTIPRVFEFFPRLAERQRNMGNQLSGGEQQMLAISRALMGRPKLLLLDEPSLGLSPLLTLQIFEIVKRINRERGVTLLVVEQNARIALQYADYGYVLEIGRIVMHDTCAALREKDDIREFYLGVKQDGAREGRRWKKKKTWR